MWSREKCEELAREVVEQFDRTLDSKTFSTEPTGFVDARSVDWKGFYIVWN